ncbi:MAG: hypothetical protein HC933_23225, partial [Pleurocapsa sp. SU_196_0]|nr:hypothetical protein [Pleurocapsa sp. SU_196_0]
RAGNGSPSGTKGWKLVQRQLRRATKRPKTTQPPRPPEHPRRPREKSGVRWGLAVGN